MPKTTNDENDMVKAKLPIMFFAAIKIFLWRNLMTRVRGIIRGYARVPSKCQWPKEMKQVFWWSGNPPIPSTISSKIFFVILSFFVSLSLCLRWSPVVHAITVRCRFVFEHKLKQTPRPKQLSSRFCRPLSADCLLEIVKADAMDHNPSISMKIVWFFIFQMASHKMHCSYFENKRQKSNTNNWLLACRASVVCRSHMIIVIIIVFNCWLEWARHWQFMFQTHNLALS